MMLTLRDWYSKREHEVPDARCECCGAKHDVSNRAGKLVLDHTWWEDGSYFLTVLCGICNVRKQDLPYVSSGPDRCWWPGMPPGATVAKLGTHARTSYRNGRVTCDRRSEPVLVELAEILNEPPRVRQTA